MPVPQELDALDAVHNDFRRAASTLDEDSSGNTATIALSAIHCEGRIQPEALASLDMSTSKHPHWLYPAADEVALGQLPVTNEVTERNVKHAFLTMSERYRDACDGPDEDAGTSDSGGQAAKAQAGEEDNALDVWKNWNKPWPLWPELFMYMYSVVLEQVKDSQQMVIKHSTDVVQDATDKRNSYALIAQTRLTLLESKEVALKDAHNENARLRALLDGSMQVTHTLLVPLIKFIPCTSCTGCHQS
jgi:hypothetical protein